jgi:hypothetical protein
VIVYIDTLHTILKMTYFDYKSLLKQHNVN